MAAKSQQFNAKLNYPFGGMKIVIGHIINQLLTISFAPAIVKVVLMRVRVIPVIIQSAIVTGELNRIKSYFAKLPQDRHNRNKLT